MTGATVALVFAQLIGILQPAKTAAVPVVRLQPAPKPKAPQVRAVPNQAPVEKPSPPIDPPRPKRAALPAPRKTPPKKLVKDLPPSPKPTGDPVVIQLQARYAALSQTRAASSKIVDLADAVYKHADKHPNSRLKTPVLRCADLIRTHNNPKLEKLKGCLNGLKQLYKAPKRLPREEEF